MGYTTAICGRIKCARLRAGFNGGVEEGTVSIGGSGMVARFEFTLEVALPPVPLPKNLPNPPMLIPPIPLTLIPLVILDNSPVGGGGGFFRMLFPGIGIVTEDVDARRTGGVGRGEKEGEEGIGEFGIGKGTLGEERGLGDARGGDDMGEEAIIAV